MSETDDDKALAKYATALQRFLTYFDAPERTKDPDWWDRVLQNEYEAWSELNRRNLLDTPKYSEVVLNAHRLANRLRVARGLA